MPGAVLIFMLALSAAAPAAKQRIAILPAISGPSSATNTSAIYGEVARDIALRPSLEAVPWDELLSEGEEPLAAAALACGSDSTCLAARLARADIPLGLRIAIDLELSPPLASMILVDAASRRSLGESVVELPNLADTPRELRALAAKLLDSAGHALGGRVAITVSPPDAELTLSGELVPRALTLPAGRYELRASKRGFHDAQAIAIVTAGNETAIAILLEPEPEPFVGSTWFWAAIGATAALAGTTAIVLATDPFASKIECLCLAVPGGTCACPPK